MTVAMKRAGVKIMAGSDLPIGEVAPVHDELAFLVESGLTAMEALQTPTRNVAEFLGMLRDEGTIEPGKVANLLIVDGNPLDDIRNTRRVSHVISLGAVVR
jgi:imidazolonepropionase-like amidohydrolase